MDLRKWRRRAFVGLGILAVAGGVGLWFLNWLMSQPMYVFGSVRDQMHLTGALDPPKQGREGVWQVEPDIELSYHAHGEGRPVLVVHGGPGIPYAKCWKGLEPFLGERRLYFYDQRGCGDSTRPHDVLDGSFYENLVELEASLGLGAQIADIERIRRILGEEQLTLIGHSFGGFIASMYAAEFPERVDKLILVAPAGVITPPDGETDLFTQTRSRLPETQRSEFDQALEEYLDFGDLFSKSEDELISAHEEMGTFILTAMGVDPESLPVQKRSGGWSVYALYFSLGRDYDFRPALQSIEAETLIVVGANDDMAKAGTKSYRIIPNSRYEEVAGTDCFAGHFVYDDCPAEFAAVLRSELKHHDVTSVE